MPKDISERIIDSPFSPTTRGGSVTIGSGGGGGGGGATNLDALTDVTLAAPANGQTLAYNSGTGQWVNAAPAVMTAHDLSGPFHTGLLNWDRLDFTPSDMANIATRRHIDLQGMTANDHHDHVHPLIGNDTDGVMQHTATGLTAGHVVRASGPTTFAWAQLQHTDLGSILPDQHHRRDHNIITGDVDGNVVHSITGSQFQLVGATALNTLGLLTPTPTPGAAAAILRTDSNGGIQLDTNLLYVDGANNWIGINRTPSGATLDVIAFSNADHTQRIKQKAGQTGRMWRIEDTAGNELIVLDSVGNLQSGRPGFVSGLTGWQITPQGNAEFNNIWARGELHATVFVKDEVHATGGSLLVATAGVLHDDAVISSSTVDDDTLVVYSTPAGAGVPLQVVTTSGTFTGTELHVSWIGNFININDPPSGPGFYFQPGDIIRSKTEVATGVTDFWLEVNNAQQNSGYSTYSVYKRSGTDGTLPKGSAVVSYGKEGDGRILLTSDLNYAPYIDVFTTGPNVWTGDAGSVIPRMRMGRLDGIGLPGVSGVTQYGMIAGKDLSDANSGYFIASNLGISLYKVPIRVNNGTSDTGLWTPEGNLKLGSNIGTLATTSFEVVTQGSNAGDVYIGDRTGTINPANPAYLYWNQQAGTLFIRGDLLVAGGPGAGYVTVADAHLWDGQVDTAAQGYAGNAQTYGDARRIVGVNGSWDSPTSTSIRWGTKATSVSSPTALSAAMASGGSRTIADHASASILVSARTYFYVNVSGTGTMTMGATNNIATVIGVNNVLIAVADPGDSSTKACSITVVAGSTYMSGSNIFTGSIVAANIAAGTITADKLVTGTITSTYLDPTYVSGVNSGITTAAAKGQQGIDDAAAASTAAGNAQTGAQTYSDNRRVVGVTGAWTVVDGSTISWTALRVKFANGSDRGITFQNGHTLTGGGRHYLYVDMSGSGNMAMLDTITLGDLGVNNALIAVADAGAVKASVSIVAGSTYISGDNIMTGSIVAANIAANTITADRLVTSQITSTYLAPAVNTSITTAQNTANNAAIKAQQGVDDAADAATAASNNAAFAEARRVVGVSGTWTALDGNTITWVSLSVKFSQGAARPITPSAIAPAGYPLSGAVGTRHYLYITVTDVTLVLKDTTSLGPTSMFANDVLIAVADVGTVKASINIVAGSTYISGDNIMTGSIVASNIAARTITATYLNVDRLDGVRAGTVYTGTLEMDSNSNIHSAGKTGYGGSPAPAGFFLGYSGTTYRFDVGDTNSYLRWDGSNLVLKTLSPLQLTTSGSDVFLYVTSRINAGRVAQLQFDLGSNNAISTDYLKANYQLSAQTLALDYTAGPIHTDMITLKIGARTDTLHYNSDGAGVLAYSAAMTVSGAFTAGGAILTASNSMRIATPFTPTNSSSPAGTQGDIRYDGNFIYVWTGGAWRRAVLNIF